MRYGISKSRSRCYSVTILNSLPSHIHQPHRKSLTSLFLADIYFFSPLAKRDLKRKHFEFLRDRSCVSGVFVPAAAAPLTIKRHAIYSGILPRTDYAQGTGHHSQGLHENCSDSFRRDSRRNLCCIINCIPRVFLTQSRLITYRRLNQRAVFYFFILPSVKGLNAIRICSDMIRVKKKLFLIILAEDWASDLRYRRIRGPWLNLIIEVARPLGFRLFGL